MRMKKEHTHTHKQRQRTNNTKFAQKLFFRLMSKEPNVYQQFACNNVSGRQSKSRATLHQDVCILFSLSLDIYAKRSWKPFRLFLTSIHSLSLPLSIVGRNTHLLVLAHCVVLASAIASGSTTLFHILDLYVPLYVVLMHLILKKI